MPNFIKQNHVFNTKIDLSDYQTINGLKEFDV